MTTPGNPLGDDEITGLTGQWQPLTLELTATDSDPRARLGIPSRRVPAPAPPPHQTPPPGPPPPARTDRSGRLGHSRERRQQRDQDGAHARLRRAQRTLPHGAFV